MRRLLLAFVYLLVAAVLGFLTVSAPSSDPLASGPLFDPHGLQLATGPLYGLSGLQLATGPL